MEASDNDIDKLFKLRAKYHNNPIFAYYNINSLRTIFTDLNEIFSKCIPDVLVFAETKLDSSFPNAQFYIDNYYEPIRADYSSNSGGMIEYIRKGVIRKSLPDYKLKHFESIASELTITKNKWFMLSFYRTHRAENKLSNIIKFLQELSTLSNKVINKYDHVLIMGDINIDLHDKKSVGYKELVQFMDTFGLTNLVKEKTCYFKGHESSIDVILTNRPTKFYISRTFELGVSDCHKMITTTLRAHVPRIKSKNIHYRSFKTFNGEKFLKELKENVDIDFYISDTNSTYNNLIDILVALLDKFAPMKKKRIRGNQSRFMNKHLSKAIMKRSALKNKYLRDKNVANRDNYKKQRNLCVSMKRNAIKEDLKKTSSNLKGRSKPFYDMIKPYLTNKGALCSNDITLLENNILISNEKELADIFNDYYINIVKYSCDKEPTNIADHLKPGTESDEIIDKIVDTYKNHPSIHRIKATTPEVTPFFFRPTTEDKVITLLKSIDPKKSVGLDLIPPKIIRDSAEILAKPLTDLINQSIKENVFPSKAKIASVLPFFKKEDRLLKNNYRPISVLSAISKIFEKI